MPDDVITNGDANTQSNGNQKRVLRIAGVSGGVFDRFRAMQDLAKDPSIHGKQSFGEDIYRS
jgi:hypothetical protein